MKGHLVINDMKLRIDDIQLVDGALKFTARGIPQKNGAFAPGDTAKVYDRDGGHVATFSVPDTSGDREYKEGVGVTYRLPVTFRNDGTGVPKLVNDASR